MATTEQQQADLTKQLDEAAKALAAAQTDYVAAEAAESRARNHCSDSLNALNRAQGRFDEVAGKLRKLAPVRSDWRQSERRSYAVETP